MKMTSYIKSKKVKIIVLLMIGLIFVMAGKQIGATGICTCTPMPSCSPILTNDCDSLCENPIGGPGFNDEAACVKLWSGSSWVCSGCSCEPKTGQSCYFSSCSDLDKCPLPTNPQTLIVNTGSASQGICTLDGECFTSGCASTSYTCNSQSQLCNVRACGGSSSTCANYEDPKWGSQYKWFSVGNTPAETYCSDGIDNDCDGLIDCLDPDCAGADPPTDPSLIIQNSGGTEIAKIGSNGAMKIRGSLQSLGSPNGNDFLIQNSAGTTVAWIDDANGNLHLLGVVDGDGTWSAPSGSGNFIIQNSLGTTVAYFDSSGNLFLSYSLIENGY